MKTASIDKVRLMNVRIEGGAEKKSKLLGISESRRDWKMFLNTVGEMI